MFGIFFILPLLLAARARAPFVCPPAEEIYPCECRSYPTAAVRCDGISNLASVREALGGHFQDPLPRLQLYNMHTFSLPPYALGDLSPRRLVLQNSHIRAIDEHAFEGQSSLGLLILADDRLQDVPSAPLQRLTGLQSLSLAGNLLMTIRRGALDLIDSLRFLVLSDNRISEIEKGAFPQHLDTLVIARNLLSTLNGSLEDLEKLHDLVMSGNRLTDIRREFRGLRRLRRLALDHNYISNISGAFEDLHDLHILSLASNRIQIVDQVLNGLHSLQILNLSRNYINELDLRGLEQLEILDLSGNYLKNVCSTLRPLTSLRELGLSDMNLRSLDPNCFSGLKTLMSLDLSHNLLSSADAVFVTPLPSLLHLQLNHNRIRSLTRHEQRKTNLRELDISYNQFSSFKFYQWSNDKHLKTLEIEGNPWECTEQLMQGIRSLEQKGIFIQGRPLC